MMGDTCPEEKISESADSFAKPAFSEPSVVVPDGSGTACEKSFPKTNPIKRTGSGCGTQANGSLSSSQQSPMSETTPIALGEGSGSSLTDPSKGGSNWEYNGDGGLSMQHHGEGDRRGGFSRNRRGNNNGGGGFHRGSAGWNSSRGFNNRDPRMSIAMPLIQQRRYSRRPFGQPPPPPPPAPFIGVPPHVRPIVAPMGYSDVPPRVYYVPAPPPNDQLRNVPFIPHQSPQAIASTVYLAPLDQLRRMILKQIEYYFSFENLLKDTYLRQKMDDQGWVSISLIAGFNRVKQLTHDIPFILESLRSSTVVEIQGKKIRRRYDWMTWLLPSTPHQHGIVSRPQYSLTSSVDSILAHVQNLGLSESASRLSNSSHWPPPAIGGGLDRTVSENLNIQRRNGASANAIDKVSSPAGSIVI